jgi:AbrB family looped-hinge helix DNA binding protein
VVLATAGALAEAAGAVGLDVPAAGLALEAGLGATAAGEAGGGGKVQAGAPACVQALELARLESPQVGAAAVTDGSMSADGLGDAGPALDAEAKAAYRERLREIRREIAEAEGWNDPERVARLQAEEEALKHELIAALGLGGRDRSAASAAERSRVSVTRAIRAALVRIAEQSPALGDHFDATIRTGTFCSQPRTTFGGLAPPRRCPFCHRSGIVDAMKTTIDKAGRLVIPRPLRDRIGLVGGGEVELELDGAAIRIEPVGGSGLREEGGLLVIPASGTPLTAAALRELIDGDRHGR